MTSRFARRGPYWIGLTDDRKEGHWIWTSGELVAFTRWGASEPNGGRRENYAANQWGPDRKWNGVDSQTRLYGIIEVTNPFRRTKQIKRHQQ
ncbi:MAG: C-type lectin domain-containing protein [Planctomycetota bacterium]